MIAQGIKSAAEAGGHIMCLAYPVSRNNRPQGKDDYLLCSNFVRRVNHRLAYYSGLQGCFALGTTYRLLKKIQTFQPDLIHLHNIHGDFINLPMLFWYIKKYRIPLVWTLHDCWAFTGRCPHFIMVNCEKWKTGCFQCAYPPRAYPEGLLDQSKFNWTLKRRCFTDVENMALVAPSNWLASLVKTSFLKAYPVHVIHNGIDLSVFRPIESDFRKRYQITAKFILLGVSFSWDKRKGLDVFLDLFHRLEQTKYQIVLVGTDDEIDSQLPSNIISIPRTKNQTELVKIYSAADLFVNPTREETLGLVNVEALACGIPVVTFRTGGSPECMDESSGSVVECDDIDGLEHEIRRICASTPYSSENCIKRALAFDRELRFQEYVRLFEQICS